ncbi:MAG: Bbp16 family capsid cement protein [Pseudomonadota bacterium]
MTFVSAQEVLSDGQEVSVTALSTNVIDLFATPATIHNQGAALRNLILGGTVPLTLAVGTAVTAAGAATVTVTIESDSVATIDASPTVHWSSGAVGKAALVAGYNFSIDHLPPGDYERYLAVRYTVATGPLTAGKFFAYLGGLPQTNVW